MHDDARRHEDAKKKITSNSNIGDFSGSLQSTPLTRDLAPRSTLMYGERVGETIESSSFMLTFPGLNVDLFFSTPLTRGFFSTPPTRDARSC
jgi:hypothetical protein